MTVLKGKGKVAVKAGMQYGKLITDSRFYKPPKYKRKTSFRAIARAVRDSAVCLHRSFMFPSQLDDSFGLQFENLF